MSNRNMPVNLGEISQAFMGNLQQETYEEVSQISGQGEAFQNVSQLSQEFNLTAGNNLTQRSKAAQGGQSQRR